MKASFRERARSQSATDMGRIATFAASLTMSGSTSYLRQSFGIKQVEDQLWLVSFMDYDLGYFDNETCRLEPLHNPFGPKVLPMSPE
jgi:putative transposase